MFRDRSLSEREYQEFMDRCDRREAGWRTALTEGTTAEFLEEIAADQANDRSTNEGPDEEEEEFQEWCRLQSEADAAEEWLSR